MKAFFPLTVATGASALAAVFAGAAEPDVRDNLYLFGLSGTPPAEAVYAFGSPLQGEGSHYGDLATLQLHAVFVDSIEVGGGFHWLAGIEWGLVQASVPGNAPIPESLQSAGLVLGADWQVNSRWRAWLEVSPGVYSDFQDVTGSDINAPFTTEVSYVVNDRLVVGLRLNVNARRETPVIAFPAVRWQFADRWLLNLWLPRPEVDFQATKHFSLFAGAALSGGTYQVSRDFGRDHDLPALDSQLVDFREIRVGGGLRYTLGRRFTAELSGGWVVDRRYNYFDADYELKTDGAPYVQAGFQFSF